MGGIGTAELAAVIQRHGRWVRGELGGECADLRRANLSGANLRGANLRWANLRLADMREANLRLADLREADLSRADLRRADLREANLSRVNLRGADLREARLPAPTMMLLASWKMCTRGLTRDLMRYEAANHPDPQAFDRWARGGPCPYGGLKIERVVRFCEDREAWAPGPAPTAFELMTRLICEHCADSDYHDRD